MALRNSKAKKEVDGRYSALSTDNGAHKGGIRIGTGKVITSGDQLRL